MGKQKCAMSNRADIPLRSAVMAATALCVIKQLSNLFINTLAVHIQSSNAHYAHHHRPKHQLSGKQQALISGMTHNVEYVCASIECIETTHTHTQIASYRRRRPRAIFRDLLIHNLRCLDKLIDLLEVKNKFNTFGMETHKFLLASLNPNVQRFRNILNI